MKAALLIAVCALCTFGERLLPFLLFEKRSVPPVIRRLGALLPSAVMTVLVLYCMRGLSFSSAAGWVPQIVPAAVTVALHLWKRNTLLSVAAGTVCSMIFVQTLGG